MLPAGNLFDDPLSEPADDADGESANLTPDAAAYAAPLASGELADWIVRIADRDEKALTLLYDAVVGKVYGLVLRIAANRQLAEEVTEDVFWQVWRQAPRFDPARGTPLAWIMTIARSRALDALRRREPAEALDADPGIMEVSPDANPLDLLSAVQRNSQIHQALAEIEALPRQLVALAFFKGLSHEEIASHTGLPLGTVKSHIRRAMLRLRELLQGLTPGDMVTQ